MDRRTDRVKKREEKAMFQLYSSGLTHQEIAKKLDRKVETVKRHLAAISAEGTAYRTEIADVVPRELIFEIRKLARRVQQLTHVPKPTRAFLPDSSQAETEVAKLALKGNAGPLMSAMISGMRTPWWCTTGPVEIGRCLTWEQEALFDRFKDLPESQKFKVALGNWEERVNRYIDLKRSNAGAQETREAYLEANEAQIAVHSELWAAVEALRWGSQKHKKAES